jgi:hypothetical protein
MSSNNTVVSSCIYLYCMCVWSYQVISIVLHYTWNSSEFYNLPGSANIYKEGCFNKVDANIRNEVCLVSYSDMCCYLLRQCVLFGNQWENLVWCMKHCLMHDIKKQGNKSCIDPFFHSSFSCRFLQEKRDSVFKQKDFPDLCKYLILLFSGMKSCLKHQMELQEIKMHSSFSCRF